MKQSAYDPEVLKVRVFAASGNYDLFYYGTTGILRLANFPVGCSADTFKNNLWSLYNIAINSPTVTRIAINAQGSETSIAAEIAGYEYTISIHRYRPPTALPYTRTTALVAGSVTASVSVIRVN
jgi:hypothetical protein